MLLLAWISKWRRLLLLPASDICRLQYVWVPASVDAPGMKTTLVWCYCLQRVFLRHCIRISLIKSWIDWFQDGGLHYGVMSGKHCRMEPLLSAYVSPCEVCNASVRYQGVSRTHVSVSDDLGLGCHSTYVIPMCRLCYRFFQDGGLHRAMTVMRAKWKKPERACKMTDVNKQHVGWTSTVYISAELSKCYFL